MSESLVALSLRMLRFLELDLVSERLQVGVIDENLTANVHRSDQRGITLFKTLGHYYPQCLESQYVQMVVTVVAVLNELWLPALVD